MRLFLCGSPISTLFRYYLFGTNSLNVWTKEFEQMNWLPVSERFNQCICSNAFKCFNEKFLLYLYDLYKPSWQNQINTRSSILKLKHPSRSKGSDQNTLSYLTPTISNNLSTCLKLSNSLSSFKHGVKEHSFKKLKNKEQDIFAY